MRANLIMYYSQYTSIDVITLSLNKDGRFKPSLLHLFSPHAYTFWCSVTMAVQSGPHWIDEMFSSRCQLTRIGKQLYNTWTKIRVTGLYLIQLNDDHVSEDGQMEGGDLLASLEDFLGPVARSFHGPKRTAVPRSSAPPGDGCRKRFSLRPLSAKIL